MNQPALVYQLPSLWTRWRDTLRQHLPCLSLPRIKGVALFSLGLALSRRSTLAVVAEALPDFGKADTLERRLQRFLAADNVQVPACQQALVHWVSATLPVPRQMVLLIDETSLQEHLRVMCVSLAYQGRALPLCWEVYAGNACREQVPLVSTLLHRIAACLPPDTCVLVQADRGIGCSPDLLRVIRALGWHYLVRVTNLVRLLVPQPPGDAAELPELAEVRFADQVMQVGAQWTGEDVYAFKKAGWLRCRALGWWGVGHKEPWLLLTNAPEVTAKHYALRMWEETAFKDLKSNAFNWQRSHVHNVQHADKLWLLMSVATLLLLNLGAQAASQPALRRQVTRGTTTRRSVLQLGIRCLQRLRIAAMEAAAMLTQLQLWPPLPDG